MCAKFLGICPNFDNWSYSLLTTVKQIRLTDHRTYKKLTSTDKLQELRMKLNMLVQYIVLEVH